MKFKKGDRVTSKEFPWTHFGHGTVLKKFNSRDSAVRFDNYDDYKDDRNEPDFHMVPTASLTLDNTNLIKEFFGFNEGEKE